jgi:hypothetical protein
LEFNFISIGGKLFAVSDVPLSLYNLGDFLQPIGGRLLRSYEVARLHEQGFEFGALDFAGKFWTATKVSCSLNCAWQISEGGFAQPVPGGWDKTFLAWGVAVPISPSGFTFT